jgi:transcriptional regulator with XRE-family HTH domain
MSTNLKSQRLARDLDQTELAALIGCGQPTISHYETGASRPRRKSVLGARLEAFFGMSLADLLAPVNNENGPR